MIRITEDVISKNTTGLFCENLSGDTIVLESWKSSDVIKNM